jgi:integrase
MELLAAFLTAKRAAGLSPNTLRWYSCILTAWLSLHPQIQSTPTEIEAYLAGLRARRLSAATVAGHYRALNVWFAWLVECGAIPTSPMRSVRRPKTPQKRVAYVTVSEINALVASLTPVPKGSLDGHNWLDARDRALALLLFYSGLRNNEALGLQVDDVDVGRRLLYVERAKGGAPRISPFASEVAPALLEYLYRRPPSEYRDLWLANDGAGNVRGVLTPNGVRQMFRRRCKAAGLRYLNPHSFRHGFAMWTLNAGMELSAVSAAMGHSSTQVTQHTYARWLPEAVQREYDEATTRLRGRGRNP